ncbi:hypothetical protein ACFQH6_02910 [Halobacteriaceae archaeon GCM10025711]
MPTDEHDLTETERQAVHEVELGLQWLRRAHGALLEFHHSTGHAMDHLFDAESQLRDIGHDDLADRLRDDLLPAGVTDDDQWTYELVEQFEAGHLNDVATFEADVRAAISGGRRHVAERVQQDEWRRRSERD